MAEGMLRAWGSDRFDVFSAGTHAATIRPEAVAVMAEAGIDITGQRSKSLDTFRGQSFDWLITVCDRARRECPIFPGVQHTAHWGIDDPGEVKGDEETRLAAFRSARDEVRNRVRLLLATASRADSEHPARATIADQA